MRRAAVRRPCHVHAERAKPRPRRAARPRTRGPPRARTPHPCTGRAACCWAAGDARRRPGARVGARTRLRGGVEHGVAAALVGEHEVVGAGAVAQRQRRALAWPPAVAPGVAGAQEARKHAVLGVEYGQVVVRDRLQRGRPAPRRPSAGCTPAAVGVGRRIPWEPGQGAWRLGSAGRRPALQAGWARAQLGARPRCSQAPSMAIGM